MKSIILVAIILLASTLRLWQLGSVPPSPDWDEVALGYNAYSIAQTGKDEYGQAFPIVLRSFDDYKPALYAYLAIPAIKLFGLNVFAVRLPSAILGIFTVVAAYFLVRELFSGVFHPRGVPQAQHHLGGVLFSSTSEVSRGEGIALLGAFLLAISPWHLQFSRIAFESNVGLAFNVFSALFFVKGLKKPWLLSLSALFAGLSFYTYQSEKIFTPLLLLVLVLVFRKELFILGKKYFLLAFVTLFIVSLPLVNYTLTDRQALLRARGVSAFADQTVFLERNARKLLRDKENQDFLGLVLDNRRVQYVLAGASGYLSHFDFNWLFITGDEARHHAPNMGLLYLWELPFLLLGIYSLAVGKWDNRLKFFVFGWLLIAPLPASITSGVPHAVRTLNFLPTWQIFIAIGIITALIKVSSIKYQVLSIKVKQLIIGCLLLVVGFNLTYYLNQYFVQQNYFNSQSWQYGYKEAVKEIQKIEDNYDKIVVTNKPHLDQSYMFFLFYTKYDPIKYQREGGTISGGFAEPHRGFSKYTFRPIEWEKEKRDSEILYVGRPSDFPEGVKVIKTINFLDGKEAIKIVEG